MEMLQNDLVLTVSLFILVVFTVGGIAWGIFYPRLSKNHERDQRMAAIRMSKMQVADKRLKAAANDRRKDIEANLKQLEEKEAKGRKQKASLAARLSQAGVETTPRQFYTYSVVCCVCLLHSGHGNGCNPDNCRRLRYCRVGRAPQFLAFQPTQETHEGLHSRISKRG